MIVLVLIALAVMVPAWLALERRLVMRANGVTRVDVRRGYVRLERDPSGRLVVRPGRRSVTR